MSNISDLFTHFMSLIGLNYYNKTESDNKYALKTEIPSSSTVDNSLSSSSEHPVQNKVIKSALDDKVDISQGSGNGGKNVVTDNSGDITLEDKPTIPSASSTTPSADTLNGDVGNGVTWARSNHKHPKSSLYAEASHNHPSIYTSDGSHIIFNDDENGLVYFGDDGEFVYDYYGDLVEQDQIGFYYLKSGDYIHFDDFIVEGDSRLTNSRTPTSHTHGNISNTGAITTTIDAIDTTNDKIVVTDYSDSSKLKNVSFVDALNDVVLDLIDEAS